MAAKPCDLHHTQCTCAWGTTRPLDHANLEHVAGKRKQVIGNVELPQNRRWLPNYVTYIVPATLVWGGDHPTNSTCKFKHTVGKHY